MPPLPDFAGLLSRRDALIRRLTADVSVTGARRAGDPQTVIRLDTLLPDVADPHGVRARWRLRTAKNRLHDFPSRTECLTAFHAADAPKGRRLVAVDRDAENLASAILAWHFEPTGSITPRRQRRGRQRPHLVTAMAVRHDATGRMRTELMASLLLLVCAACAIDARTVCRRRVGVQSGGGIVLATDELAAMGFIRGPSVRNGGYGDNRYYEVTY